MVIKKISYHLTSFSLGYRNIDKLILLFWEIFFKIPILLLFPLLGDLKSFTRVSKGVYKLLPSLYIKLNDCIFRCRRRSLDFPYLFPTYEMNLERIFENIKEGIFVDVGAHIGRYTITVGKKLGKKGKVISIEPEPSNFRALLKNIELNNLKNIISLNLACFSRNGKINLYLSDTDEGSHSCTKKVGNNYLKVESKTLDRILKELKIKSKDVKLIKIDVEGVESSVLKGGKKLFEGNDTIIIFECLDSSSLHECEKILNSWNYKIRKIDNSNSLAYKSPHFSNYFFGVSLN